MEESEEHIRITAVAGESSIEYLHISGLPAVQGSCITKTIPSSEPDLRSDLALKMNLAMKMDPNIVTMVDKVTGTPAYIVALINQLRPTLKDDVPLALREEISKFGKKEDIVGFIIPPTLGGLALPRNVIPLATNTASFKAARYCEVLIKVWLSHLPQGGGNFVRYQLTFEYNNPTYRNRPDEVCCAVQFFKTANSLPMKDLYLTLNELASDMERHLNGKDELYSDILQGISLSINQQNLEPGPLDMNISSNRNKFSSSICCSVCNRHLDESTTDRNADQRIDTMNSHKPNSPQSQQIHVGQNYIITDELSSEPSDYKDIKVPETSEDIPISPKDVNAVMARIAEIVKDIEVPKNLRRFRMKESNRVEVGKLVELGIPWTQPIVEATAESMNNNPVKDDTTDYFLTPVLQTATISKIDGNSIDSVLAIRNKSISFEKYGTAESEFAEKIEMISNAAIEKLFVKSKVKADCSAKDRDDGKVEKVLPRVETGVKSAGSAGAIVKTFSLTNGNVKINCEKNSTLEIPDHSVMATPKDKLFTNGESIKEVRVIDDSVSCKKVKKKSGSCLSTSETDLSTDYVGKGSPFVPKGNFPKTDTWQNGGCDSSTYNENCKRAIFEPVVKYEDTIKVDYADYLSAPINVTNHNQTNSCKATSIAKENATAEYVFPEPFPKAKLVTNMNCITSDLKNGMGISKQLGDIRFIMTEKDKALFNKSNLSENFPGAIGFYGGFDSKEKPRGRKLEMNSRAKSSKSSSNNADKKSKEFDDGITISSKGVVWLKGSSRFPPSYPELFPNLGLDLKRMEIEGETSFCDPAILSELLTTKSAMDDFSQERKIKAKCRANVHEAIENGLFCNRSGIKMANLDYDFDYLFTEPKDRGGTSLVNPNELLFFADVCCGPGGLSDYILWRKGWWAKGIGFTSKCGAQVKLDKFANGYPGNYDVFYGANDDGNIHRAKNVNSLCERVMEMTNGIGVHVMVADGGYNVHGKENVQEIVSKRLVLCKCLTALKIVRVGGIFMTNLFDLFTPFSAGLIYLMHLCFDEISLHKPVASRPANSERFLVCKGKRNMVDGVVRYLNLVNGELAKARNADKDVRYIFDVNVLTDPSSWFFKYLYNSNNNLGKAQIVELKKLIDFYNDPSKVEKEQKEMGKICRELWNIPNPPNPNIRGRQANKVAESLIGGNIEANYPIIIADLSINNARQTLNRHVGYFCSFTGNIVALFLSLGKDRLFKLVKNIWVPCNSPFNIPKNSVVFGEITTGIKLENTATEIEIFNLIDAAFLGGQDIRALPTGERLQLCQTFSQSLRHRDNLIVAQTFLLPIDINRVWQHLVAVMNDDNNNEAVLGLYCKIHNHLLMKVCGILGSPTSILPAKKCKMAKMLKSGVPEKPCTSTETYGFPSTSDFTYCVNNFWFWDFEGLEFHFRNSQERNSTAVELAEMVMHWCGLQDAPLPFFRLQKLHY